MRLALAAVLALGLVACGGDVEPRAPTAAEESWCDDMRGGLTIVEGYGQVVEVMRAEERADPPAEAAAFIESAVTNGCPEVRPEWEATVAYRQLVG